MQPSLRLVQTTLRALGDINIAQHSQRFFKTGRGGYAEGDKFLGIRVPVLREIAKKHSMLPLVQAEKLLSSRFHEERMVALLILVHAYRRAKDDAQKAIYMAYLDNTDYINNWNLVDTSAQHIVGAHLFRRNKQPLRILAKSDSLWERRIAIMSTFYFIRQGAYSTTIQLAKILLRDEHDLIHKAAGWMLREIGNRDRAVEEEFLLKYYKAMPRTMLRYAIEKFPEKQRQRYLTGAV